MARPPVTGGETKNFSPPGRLQKAIEDGGTVIVPPSSMASQTNYSERFCQFCFPDLSTLLLLFLHPLIVLLYPL